MEVDCNIPFIGGGAIEMELSRALRDYSRTIAGKEQLLIGAIAKALEIIPRQLCDNAGFDATNILNKLRQKHAQGVSKYVVENISTVCKMCIVWLLGLQSLYESNYS